MKEARIFLGNGLIAPAAAVYFHVFLSRIFVIFLCSFSEKT